MKKAILNSAISLLVLTGLLSCNSKEKYTAPVFKDMGSITGDTIVRDVMCTYIPNIYIVDSLLVVECINSIDKKAFYIYNKNSGKLLKTFGFYGNGPGELPTSFNHTLDKDTKILYAMGGKTNVSFNIDSVLLNNNYSFGTHQTLHTTANSAKLFFYKDSLFCSMNDMRPERDYRLAIINSTGDTITCNREFPAINMNMDANNSMEERVFYTLRTIGCIKPDGTKFAIATTCGLHLELFDISTDKISRTDLKRFIEPKYIANPMRNNGIIPGLVWSLNTSDKYIYGMWSEDTDKLFPEKIVTFNWKGDPISQYCFGPGMVGGWTIEDDSAVYITMKDSQGKLNIVKYKLQ